MEERPSVMVMSRMCMTKDIGINGNLFGGYMLAWMDEAAAIYARQVTHEQVVTLKFSEVIFTEPVKVGDILEFNCRAIKCGNTSVTIEIRVTRWGNFVLAAEAVFVAVDEQGKKKVINWR